MSEKPIDAVAVLVGFLVWCNEAPNQQHPVVENTRRLCDALAQILREKASLESRVAELEGLMPDPYISLDQTDGHKYWSIRACRKCYIEWPSHADGCVMEQFDHEGTKRQRAALRARPQAAGELDRTQKAE